MRRSYVSVSGGGVASDADALAVIGYPNATARQKKARLRELEGMGISSVSFWGPTMLGRTPVLGKGYAGVVVLARGTGAGGRSTRVALKIRRTDSPRPHMKHEGALLRAANKAGVGPRMHAHSRNFLAMEYVGGQRIGDWLDSLRGAGSAARFRRAAGAILRDCRRLDGAGIDHGELSNISKHVIISSGDRPVLIDFEGASTERRPSNVTSITQAIYISPPIAGKARRICRIPPKDAIISSLRAYKRARDEDSFLSLLEGLGIRQQ